MKKNSWKEWFIFTKRDRNAAFILLAIIAVLMALPYFFPAKKLEIHVDKELQAELDKYKQENPQTGTKSFYAASQTTIITDTEKHELFYFDPNTISEDDFIKLGLSPKTAHTVINYRSKGGYFKRPEDIRKIYSLTKNDADKIIPYIRIATNDHQQKSAGEKLQTSSPAGQTYRPATLKRTEINAATIDDWKAFPGIGDVLANRIIKFRSSMGGFKSVDQVAKTYGLSDSVFQIIRPYLYINN